MKRDALPQSRKSLASNPSARLGTGASAGTGVGINIGTGAHHANRNGADADPAWRGLLQAASAPYRAASRWAYYWAQGKLSHDPVFRRLLEDGALRTGQRVVDIGCGQGLLASLLQASTRQAAQGGWPAAWAAAPAISAYTGIDLVPREIRRAQAALNRQPLADSPTTTFVCADLRQASLPACDVVVVLDVLHYVDHAAQNAVLLRIRAALHSGGGPGRLLLRVGDAAHRRGFVFSQWVDSVVATLRGHSRPHAAGRPLAEWVALLQGLGFQVQTVAMSQGTAFANVLLVADLPTRGEPAA